MNPSTINDSHPQEASGGSAGRWQPFLQEAPGASLGACPGLPAHPRLVPLDHTALRSRPDAFHRPARSAFTLVELLVVIGIIGLLMGIAVPVVLKSLTAARTAAIKTEIDMLHMAIMNYKNEYGAYPPCIDLTVAGDGSGPGVKHVRRLFVRCANPQQQLATALTNTGNVILPLTPNNALRVWLSGYTGDATSPLAPPANRKRLYDFDLLRVNQTSEQYAPPRGQGQPYIYLDSSRYSSVDTLSVAGVGKWYVWRNDMAFNPTVTAPTSPLTTSAGYFNPDTFQIISAGLDGEFFTDDDLSNMWPSTWGDYKKRVAAGVQ